MRKLFHYGLLAGVVLLLLAVPPVFAGDFRLEAELVGDAIDDVVPSGEAEFREDDDDMRLRLEVDVEDVNLPDDTSLTVWAGGIFVGTIILAGEDGELKLDTDNEDFVPSLNSGDMVHVFAHDMLILSGTFLTVEEAEEAEEEAEEAEEEAEEAEEAAEEADEEDEEADEEDDED